MYIVCVYIYIYVYIYVYMMQPSRSPPSPPMGMGIQEEAAFETVFFKGRGGCQDKYYYATMLMQAKWTGKKQQERQG